jgi:tight adherence protein C
LLATAATLAAATPAAPAVPPWWLAAACVGAAALASAVACATWMAQRGRRAVLARLGRPSQRAARALAADDAHDPLLLRGTAGDDWRAWALRTLARVLPRGLRDDAAAARLASAGYFAPEAVLWFGAARLLAPALALVLVAAATGRATPATLGVGALIGLVAPQALVERRAGARRDALGLAIPDALDLLIVCLEAGVGVDAALVRVARELRPTHPVLAAELDNVARRTSAGLPRDEALRALVARTGVDDLARSSRP